MKFSRLLFPIFQITALSLAVMACSKQQFTKIESTYSGVGFVNLVQDNDSLNILDIENIYNGGGVGIADFNNDGNQDLFFAGNTSSNKLYLNKGEFRFEDITTKAGVGGEGKWFRGVSIVDINQDGLQDIYLCATILPDSASRENVLYVNQGLDNAKHPVFKNMAKEYGIADPSHSTMSAFFDYDNDGDLDMYLLINEIRKDEFTNMFRPVLKNREHPNTDKLFRNNWDSLSGHPVFEDVSTKAGITIEGYGHAINISDFNQDGWKDIYVTNDFLPNNILYINNRNGTFSNKVKEYFKHTSSNAMGMDVIDINNDGLSDVIELDMNPEDNLRKKMMMNPIGYENYQFSDMYGYQYQYVRNTLQLNMGNAIGESDSLRHPIFSDIAFFAGIAETDWSWSPVVADFDDDGYRDLIITNGFPKDVTDHDFIAYRNKIMNFTSKHELLEEIPEVKISNYAFRNKSDLTFENVTSSWGIETPSFSNGAAWGDLDNDGDLDLVINNINDTAFLYRNESDHVKHHFLNVSCKGSYPNFSGIGAVISLHYDQGKVQTYEMTPYRGYLSSMQSIAHFGIGSLQKIDTVSVSWPNGMVQHFLDVPSNQHIIADIRNATLKQPQIESTQQGVQPLFTNITSSLGIEYQQRDSDFVDFHIQRLLPHKLSESGPSLSVGDVNGDGLDDIISGGSMYENTAVFIQEKNGKFKKKDIQKKDDSGNPLPAEDQGTLLFDADNDGDLDLYVASGSYEAATGNPKYRDCFYVNDGKGNFLMDTRAIPDIREAKTCVKAADVDGDGDLDLMVAGGAVPGKYPMASSSHLYRNEKKNGKVVFTEITHTHAPDLSQIGMVTDALFTDFNGDGWPDLIIAAEWKPLQFFENLHGRFKNKTSSTGIQYQTGWWSSLASGDVDNDGDIDYLAGNMGTNTYYRGDQSHPISIYGDDFDHNGTYDAVVSTYLPVSKDDRTLKEFPAAMRDEFVSQLPSSKKSFPTYKEYAKAQMSDLLKIFDLKSTVRYKAGWMKSSLIRNIGNGKFQIESLPAEVQFSRVRAMSVEDYDGDGNLDVLLTGNDYGTEVSTGRYDALNGIFLHGNGKGQFKPLTIRQTGVFIPGDGRSLALLLLNNNKCFVVAAENRGNIRAFRLNGNQTFFKLGHDDVKLHIRYKDGREQAREVGYGNSYLSQSSRFLIRYPNMAAIEITNRKGLKRLIK